MRKGKLMGCRFIGVRTFRISVPRASSFFLAGTLAALLVSGAGCKKEGKSAVSSGLFLAPIQEPSQEPITVRADKLDFLREIRPRELDADLRLVPTEPSVLGRLSERRVTGVHPVTQQEIDVVTEIDRLLVSEGNSDTVLSVDICRDSGAPDCGEVKLHYSAKGLDVEGDGTRSLSPSVVPIKLQNGWILAFDSTDKNIVAFRAEAPRQRVSNGAVVDVPYRGGSLGADFGFGNGVVVSVVIRGADMMDQLGTPAEPIVTRMFELEPNKLLVFFSTTEDVHLLDLTEEEKVTDFDLADPGHPDKEFNVKFLRGNFRLFGFPAPVFPFLSSGAISSQITRDAALKLDTFQPLLVPDATVPSVGLALVFDQQTSNFMLMSAQKASGEIVGGSVNFAIYASTVRAVLQQGAGVNITEFEMSGGFENSMHPTELLFFERRTKNILAYDYSKDPAAGDNLRIFIGAPNVLVRRTAQGEVSTSTSVEPALVFATSDVRDNRLAFEQELDQVVSVSYVSGVLVIVAEKEDIALATGDILSNFTYVEPLAEDSIRAFDAQTNSLLEIRLQYAAFPITIR